MLGAKKTMLINDICDICGDFKKGTKKTMIINDICDACDNMMVSLNQVRLVYNIHTTLNPIMNDECYYKAGKCFVGLYSVYNIHTRLNPMMNATTQLESLW